MSGPKLGFSGRYKLTVFYGNSDIITQELPWFDNLITNRGLDLLGYGYNAYCYVGSNLTSLDPSICAITGVLGSSGSIVVDDLGVQNTNSPYYGYHRATYDFAAGSIQGTIRELGIGNSATDLFSRAYLLNSQGQQTSLTLSGLDRLQLTYEFRTYPPMDQFNISFDVDGTTHTGIASAAFVGTFHYSWPWILRLGIPVGGKESAFGFTSYLGNKLLAGSTSLGPITWRPDGTQVGAEGEAGPAQTVSDFIPGVYSRTMTQTWPPGIDGIDVNACIFGLLTSQPFNGNSYNSTGMWQLMFSPTFTKYYYQHITLSYSVEWARYTP